MVRFRTEGVTLDYELSTTVQVSTKRELHKALASYLYFPSTILNDDDVVEITPTTRPSQDMVTAGRWETHKVFVNGKLVGYTDGEINDE